MAVEPQNTQMSKFKWIFLLLSPCPCKKPTLPLPPTSVRTKSGSSKGDPFRGLLPKKKSICSVKCCGLSRWAWCQPGPSGEVKQCRTQQWSSILLEPPDHFPHTFLQVERSAVSSNGDFFGSSTGGGSLPAYGCRLGSRGAGWLWPNCAALGSQSSSAPVDVNMNITFWLFLSLILQVK